MASVSLGPGFQRAGPSRSSFTAQKTSGLKRSTLYAIAAAAGILPAYQTWSALVTNVRPEFSNLTAAATYIWPDVVALGFAVLYAHRIHHVFIFWLVASFSTYLARTIMILNTTLPSENLNPPLVIADFAHTLIMLLLAISSSRYKIVVDRARGHPRNFPRRHEREGSALHEARLPTRFRLKSPEMPHWRPV